MRGRAGECALKPLVGVVRSHVTWVCLHRARTREDDALIAIRRSVPDVCYVRDNNMNFEFCSQNTTIVGICEDRSETPSI